MQGNPDTPFSGGFSVLNNLGGTGINSTDFPAVYPTQQVAPVPGSSQPIRTVWGPVRGWAWGGVVNDTSDDNNIAQYTLGKPGARTQGEGYPNPTTSSTDASQVNDPPQGRQVLGPPKRINTNLGLLNAVHPVVSHPAQQAPISPIFIIIGVVALALWGG